MSSGRGRTAVVYLSRWHNFKKWSWPFLDSLARNAAGADFDLIYLLKEFPNEQDDPALDEFRDRLACPVRVFRTSDTRYDLNVYREAANNFDHDRFLFLNSYSRILAPNWLAHYLSAFDRVPQTGVVAATGSYETIPGLSFPNVNVRTNAFMIDRVLFNAIETGSLETKADTNRLEAGTASLTRQIVARGLVPLLVDRNGRAWSTDGWPISRTFRSGQQEGLLIADNRTHHYQAGSAAKRLKLARLAWGENAVVAKLSWAKRVRAEIGWRWPRIGGQAEE